MTYPSTSTRAPSGTHAMTSAAHHPDIVMATGGTGGHIYPAIAVAQVLSRHGISIDFIGQHNGMESRIVPENGFAFHGVRAGKWHRGRRDPRLALEVCKATGGFLEAFWRLKRLRPKLVVGFGGFASFPALAAARFSRIPFALHEGNAYPGKVTSWFARSARLVMVSSHKALTHLPQSTRGETVGFPIREMTAERRAARQALGLPLDGFVTLVMGGSQGSQTFNTTIPAIYQGLQVPHHSVLHSSGQHWVQEMRHRVQHTLPDQPYHVTAFVDAVQAWSAADIAITRAGISTIAEAAFHGVPLIMVPLPSSSENHQYHNAQSVAEVGGGFLAQEDFLTEQPQLVMQAWRTLLNPSENARARQAITTLSPAGAADRIAELLKALLDGSEDRTPAPSIGFLGEIV